MKKLFLFALISVFYLHANAFLKVRNYTCATVVFSVQCHDGSYNCGEVYSQYYILTGVSSMTFSNTSSLGACTVPPLYSGFTYTPSSTQNWDKVNFLVYPGAIVGHGSYGVVDIACGGLSYWDSGEFQFCGHPNLEAYIHTEGSDTYVDFNFY